MKRIIGVFALALLSGAICAQDDALSKKVRFGLMVSPSVNWYKSGEKMITKNGSVMKFGGGLGVEFRLTDVAVIATGAFISTDGGKVKYMNDVTGNPSTSFVAYYYDKENDVIENYNTAFNYNASNPTATRYEGYLLNERKYAMTYLTIPLALKLRTKEIGALTYYGMFGVNTNIRVAARATDEVQKYDANTGMWLTPTTISRTDIKKDAGILNEALNMGLGVEWNLAGSTSLVIGANYLLGFSNTVKNESEFIHKYTVGGSPNGVGLKQSLKSNAISLTVGVLF